MTFDHGELNIPGRLKGLDREIDRHLAAEREQAAEQRRQAHARRVAEREAEARRPKFTREQLENARFVRTEVGWHRVKRINKKTVTVTTAWSWTERYEFTKILEVM